MSKTIIQTRYGTAIIYSNGLLSDVEVIEEYRGKGYGQKLMDKVVLFSDHNNIVLWAPVDNLSLYEKLYRDYGFELDYDHWWNNSEPADVRLPVMVRKI